jgi:hypothetical protein
LTSEPEKAGERLTGVMGAGFPMVDAEYTFPKRNWPQSVNHISASLFRLFRATKRIAPTSTASEAAVLQAGLYQFSIKKLQKSFSH